MNENFSHTIKTETVQVMHFRNRAQAELHKAGCAHGAKAVDVYAPENAAALVEKTTTIYHDDYYFVANCAR